MQTLMTAIFFGVPIVLGITGAGIFVSATLPVCSKLALCLPYHEIFFLLYTVFAAWMSGALASLFYLAICAFFMGIVHLSVYMRKAVVYVKKRNEKYVAFAKSRLPMILRLKKI